MRRAWRGAGHSPAATRDGTSARRAAGNSARTVRPRPSSAANTMVRVITARSDQRVMRCSGERPIRATATSRPISSSFAYSTPDGQVVSQARQVRQRSRWRRVRTVASLPSSICLIW